MFRKLLFTTAILLTGSLLVFSQSGQIKGKISDKGTKEAIPFASIVLEQGGKQAGGTSTDFDGNYTIKPIPPGKYDLKATYVGYKPIMIKDVAILGDKITFQDIEMESTTINIETFEVVDYKVPLISKDQTSSGGTMTSDEIAKMPGRSAQSVAITVGGVYSQDGDMGSIRGAREAGTVTYVDGVRVRGSSSVPKEAIEQITVLTGGLPANYGDATGGVLSITTKGASRQFGLGFEGTTSQFLDNFGYNLVALSMQGPLIKGKDNNNNTALLGYFIAGDYVYQKDPRPSQIGYWYAKDDVLDNLENQPLILIPSSAGGAATYQSADFIGKEELRQSAYALNSARQNINFSGKIDVRTTKTTNLTFGGQYNYLWGNVFSYNNMLFNWKNNPYQKYNSWRVFGRFTQRFPGTADGKSLIKNVYYSIQGSYEQVTGGTEDANFGDNLFKYGYVGKFKTHKEKSYEWGYEDSLGVNAYIHNGFRDVLYEFTPSEINPVLSNFTQNYYDFFPSPDGFYNNATQVELGGGLLNGTLPGGVNSLWSNVGTPYNGYSKYKETQWTIDANGSADIGNHAFQFGIYYEQRTGRAISYAPASLWRNMRQLVNKHIEQLDLAHPHPVYDAYGVFQDTVWYDRLISLPEQAFVDYNLRQKLGMDVNGSDWIDVDNYDPETFSIDMFSADELLNNGNYYVSYYGYDHTGKEIKSRPSFDDFFNEKNENGRFVRPIGAHEPIYMAGYLSDKFAFNDLIFNIGLRLDRFDANQKVLKDPYLLYTAKTVQEVNDLGPHPTNMGSDYVVYVDDLKNPSAVNGYRNGSTWYNAQGIEISDPATIATSNGIAPYLVDPNQNAVNSSAFEDYKPQINYMPRIAFSFPISDEALFFAHYDVLTKRPTEGNFIDPSDYFFIYTTSANFINNPNLKAEKTIDYELGFQQKISNSSSIKISAYYREMRNQVQTYRFSGAYPVDYKSYNNIDFGTVKGLILQYDLRRTGNIWLRANYTLQFADGTGSDAGSGVNFVNSGQPNLRTTTPLNYDRRHTFTAVVDYRFSSGKDYNGPRISRRIKGTDKVRNIDLLQNTGVNFTFNVGSGIPYSRSSEIVATQFSSAGYLLEGSINGSRMPWQYGIDIRFDRDIMINTSKKEGKQGRPLLLNVYLELLNVLNTKNILAVYRATGNPDDDGYLSAAEYQNQINSTSDPAAYRDQYAISQNSPYRYSLPRRIRLGVLLSF